MSVMFGSRRAVEASSKTACNIAPVVSGYNQLQIAISLRECRDGEVDHVESDDAGWFRRRSEPGYFLAFRRLGRGTGAIVDRAVERRRRIAVRPRHLRADGKSLAERDRRGRRFHECRAEIRLLPHGEKIRLEQHADVQRGRPRDRRQAETRQRQGYLSVRQRRSRRQPDPARIDRRVPHRGESGHSRRRHAAVQAWRKAQAEADRQPATYRPAS